MVNDAKFALQHLLCIRYIQESDRTLLEETARQEEEMLKLKINLVEDDSEDGLFPDEDFEIQMPEDELPQEENNAPVIELKEDSEEKTNE